MFLPTAARTLSWVTRSLPNLPGRWRLVRWLEAHEQVVAGLPPATVRVAPGCRMRVNPADFDARPTYIRGLDPGDRLGRVFARLLRPGDCVLDVGANIGVYTLVAARLVGRSGCVHAFEASPPVVSKLKTNVGLNSAAAVQIHHLAVTDRCGQVEFTLARPNHSGLSSIRSLGEQGAGVVRVPTRTLDSMLAGLPPVRLVKIDVEGAELLVLRGMGELIRRDRPHIVLELTDSFLRELEADAGQVCGLLREAGYQLYEIVARGELEPLAAVPGEQCNLLACHRDRDARPAIRARGAEPATSGHPQPGAADSRAESAGRPVRAEPARPGASRSANSHCRQGSCR